MIEDNRVPFPDKGVIRFTDYTLVEKLRIDAAKSPRKRAVYRFHEYSEPSQRMLNFIFRDTYIRPHKHEDPNKVEGFLVLWGKLAVVIFNDEGEIIEVCLVGDGHEPIYAEIPPATWHTIIPSSYETFIFEVKDGPYDPNTDKKFPTWAPQEGSKEADEYIVKLRQELGFF